MGSDPKDYLRTMPLRSRIAISTRIVLVIFFVIAGLLKIFYF
jgi:hypothetical protein